MTPRTAPSLLIERARHRLRRAAERALRVARSARALTGVEATARQCRRAACRSPCSTVLARRRPRVPTPISARCSTGRGGNLNPLAYSRGLARAAITAGARILWPRPGGGLLRRAHGWSVETPADTVEAGEDPDRHQRASPTICQEGLRKTVVPVFSAIAASEPLSPGSASARSCLAVLRSRAAASPCTTGSTRRAGC